MTYKDDLAADNERITLCACGRRAVILQRGVARCAPCYLAEPLTTEDAIAALAADAVRGRAIADILERLEERKP